MKQYIIWCFAIVFASNACFASKHTYGVDDLGGEIIFSKKVIDQVTEDPKNYTIIFKYFGGKVAILMTYFEIDVNAFSEGSIQVTNEMKNIDATISIPNARNVTATISLYGFGKSLLPIMRSWPFTEDNTSTKSYTVVYVKNTSPSKKPLATNSVGARQKGDRLIHFESRNVTNISRFPSRVFEYSGDESITYARFAFNSPTAMALINTTFVSEKSFNAVAYDMNTEHFVANISIYGYAYGSTPSSYANLLGSEFYISGLSRVENDRRIVNASRY